MASAPIRNQVGDFSPPAVAEHHREGWERYLERLRVCAKGGDPGPDSPDMDASRTAPK